jgi:uncharacterized membrane protein YciS (DUF1049 family)
METNFAAAILATFTQFVIAAGIVIAAVLCSMAYLKSKI